MPNEAFSQWIISEVNKRGWSYNELARQAGLSSATISTTLSGKTNPGFEFCKGIAKAIGLPPEIVLRRAGLLPPDPPMTAQRREMDHLFTLLTTEEQEMALTMVRALVEKRGGAVEAAAE